MDELDPRNLPEFDCLCELCDCGYVILIANLIFGFRRLLDIQSKNNKKKISVLKLIQQKLFKTVKFWWNLDKKNGHRIDFGNLGNANPKEGPFPIWVSNKSITFHLEPHALQTSMESE